MDNTNMTNDADKHQFHSKVIWAALTYAISVCFMGVTHSAASDSNYSYKINNNSDVVNAAAIWAQEGAPWPRWGAHNEANKFEVDHSFWTRFMDSFGERRGDDTIVDYFYVVNRGIGDLSYYIYALEQVPVSTLRKDEQLAYWLDLHNAYAIEITAYSLTSIVENADTTRLLVLGQAWRDKSLKVEGQNLSLVDIERRIIMRQWNDPRVIYGLYLPAFGAPQLPYHPFTGDNVWMMLNKRARKFVNSNRAMEFHGDKIDVSALYFWDKKLIKNNEAVLNHLRQFARPSLKLKLADIHTIRATYLNWRLESYNSDYDRNQDLQGGP